MATTYDLIGKYFHSSDGTTWDDFTNKSGVRVLSIDGFGEIGDAVNVYTEQWVDSEIEDYMCTTKKTEQGTTIDAAVRKNVDINLTFIVSPRYSDNQGVDVQKTYDDMISSLCYGAIYLKSTYANKIAYVVCLKAVKPTAVKLNRGKDSYIMATIPFHCLKPPYKIPNT
jgi:hypothetical protein